MSRPIPFKVVLELCESYGWTLTRIWQPYRVFTKPGHLPLLVRVEDKSVSDDDFARIQEILRKEDAADGPERP
jgi:hypothetical protein